MIHQPSGGAQGQATDIDIQATEILYLRERLNAIWPTNTGQPIEKIDRDIERDYFMARRGRQGLRRRRRRCWTAARKTRSRPAEPA